MNEIAMKQVNYLHFDVKYRFVDRARIMRWNDSMQCTTGREKERHMRIHILRCTIIFMIFNMHTVLSSTFKWWLQSTYTSLFACFELNAILPGWKFISIGFFLPRYTRLNEQQQYVSTTLYLRWDLAACHFPSSFFIIFKIWVPLKKMQKRDFQGVSLIIVKSCFRI